MRTFEGLICVRPPKDCRSKNIAASVAAVTNGSNHAVERAAMIIKIPAVRTKMPKARSASVIELTHAVCTDVFARQLFT